MKDTRFIELVNLYIDRQISPEEQAELELEIQSSPRRRQVYQQYCRMHRATKLVYETFRTTSEQENSPARQPATIASIENRRRQRRARWVYAAGGLAAAACFTLVVARVNFLTNAAPAAPVVQVAAAMTPPAAPAAVAAQPAAASVNPAVAAQTPPAMRDGLFVEIDYAAMVAALREEEERLMALPRATVQQRMAASSLFDDGVFDARNGLNARNQNNLRARPQQRPSVEFTAFQFQR